jgi:hypothetical protein
MLLLLILLVFVVSNHLAAPAADNCAGSSAQTGPVSATFPIELLLLLIELRMRL